MWETLSWTRYGDEDLAWGGIAQRMNKKRNSSLP